VTARQYRPPNIMTSIPQCVNRSNGYPTPTCGAAGPVRGAPENGGTATLDVVDGLDNADELAWS
jgi:hypothetical protein